uniref:RNA helicase n=1 Tax=Amphimedon queenslandica TaxID=400682 RepID=A0A1X7SW88_AMPQE
VIRCVESVSDSVLCHFKEAAEKLIEEKGPENALCAALAYITGFTELTARSLLTSEKGYTTFMFSGEQEVRSPGYFWNIVERLFGEEARRSVRGMRLCSDNKSVVFDLPSNTAKQFESSCGTSKGITISIPQTLPELKPRPNEFYQRQQQQSRNGRWSFGRGGGGGGSVLISDPLIFDVLELALICCTPSRQVCLHDIGGHCECSSQRDDSLFHHI